MSDHDLDTLNPIEWLYTHELPVDRALKVADLLRDQLTAGGMEQVRVDFSGPDLFTIDMVEVCSIFDQFHDIGRFVFATVHSTGNRIVADWIPTFRINPSLRLQFRLVLPIVYHEHHNDGPL
jgi:hypothetical protein